MDATTIVAYANPNQKRTVRNLDGPADADASWTKKNSARAPRGKNGFSVTKPMWSADANHDIPLGIVVTTARRNDSPFSPAPLAELASGHPWFSLLAGAMVIDDRGYDSKSNNAFVHRNGGVPAIHQRGLPEGNLHNGIYTAEGTPTRLGQREMEYVRTDPDTGRHLCRCPEDGCARRDTARSVSACDDEAWENPEDNIRRFGGRIRRGSPEWNMMYAKRWSVEQVSSRWKEQGRLERHCSFGLRRVSAHARLRMLMSLAAQLDQFLAEARNGRSVG